MGGSLLLAVFAVLLLCFFALLSISTVLADRRLSESAAQSAAAYYRADSEAEALFARLRSGEMPPQVTREEDLYRYTCPISSHQTLYVELRRTDHIWEILRWQAVSADPISWHGRWVHKGTPPVSLFSIFGSQSSRLWDPGTRGSLGAQR